MAEPFSHLQGHIPAFRMKWASPRGSLKKQATFLHHHCYNPGDSCHQRWGCGFKGSLCSPSPACHTPFWCRSELPGHRRKQQGSQSCSRDWSHGLSHGPCWFMHKAWSHPPCLAGITLQPVHLPLLQALSPSIQQFLPGPSYFPPYCPRPSESSSQKEVSPLLSQVHLD